jgi:hypothetical protein
MQPGERPPPVDGLGRDPIASPQARSRVLDLHHPATGLTVAALLFAALLVARHNFAARATMTQALLDSARAGLAQLARLDESALQVGDSLPSIELRDALGASVSLAALSGRGVRYVYLYRDDCPACQLLKPFMDANTRSLPAADSLVFVAYHPLQEIPPDSLPRHYSWVHPPAVGDPALPSPRLIRGVPTLLSLSRAGRITSVAFGLVAVRNAAELFALAHTAPIDSAYIAARSGVRP